MTATADKQPVTHAANVLPLPAPPRRRPLPTPPPRPHHPWHAPLPHAITRWSEDPLGNLVVASTTTPAEADRAAMTAALDLQSRDELVAVYTPEQLDDDYEVDKAVHADVLFLLGLDHPVSGRAGGALLSIVLTRWAAGAITAVTLGITVPAAAQVVPVLTRAVGAKCTRRLTSYGDTVVLGQARQAA